MIKCKTFIDSYFRGRKPGAYFGNPLSFLKKDEDLLKNYKLINKYKDGIFSIGLWEIPTSENRFYKVDLDLKKTVLRSVWEEVDIYHKDLPKLILSPEEIVKLAEDANRLYNEEKDYINSLPVIDKSTYKAKYYDYMDQKEEVEKYELVTNDPTFCQPYERTNEKGETEYYVIVSISKYVPHDKIYYEERDERVVREEYSEELIKLAGIDLTEIHNYSDQGFISSRDYFTKEEAEKFEDTILEYFHRKDARKALNTKYDRSHFNGWYGICGGVKVPKLTENGEDVSYQIYIYGCDDSSFTTKNFLTKTQVEKWKKTLQFMAGLGFLNEIDERYGGFEFTN